MVAHITLIKHTNLGVVKPLGKLTTKDPKGNVY